MTRSASAPPKVRSRSRRRPLLGPVMLLVVGLLTGTALLVIARAHDALPTPEEVERVDPANYFFEVNAAEDDVAGLHVGVLFIDLVGRETAIPFLPEGSEGFATEVDGNVLHLMRVSHALQVERNERRYGKRATWTQLPIPLGERVAPGGRFERSVTLQHGMAVTSGVRCAFLGALPRDTADGLPAQTVEFVRVTLEVLPIRDGLTLLRDAAGDGAPVPFHHDSGPGFAGDQRTVLTRTARLPRSLTVRVCSGFRGFPDGAGHAG